jgi:two-component system chemotaxis response regulator CheB
MKPVRIVVVDDSLTIRAMIETLLERDRRVEVAGIARNGEEAIAMIRAERPDVVTLDIAMPGKDGMMILDEIMDMEPMPVIMLSSLMRDGAPIVAEAMDRGAAACFNKAMIVREAKRFIGLIREVALGVAPTAQAEPDGVALAA